VIVGTDGSVLFYICEKAEIKDIKLQKNCKILVMNVLPGGLFEYTRRPIFVSASVHFIFSDEFYQTPVFATQNCTKK
jgi:hypothetical protein